MRVAPSTTFEDDDVEANDDALRHRSGLEGHQDLTSAIKILPDRLQSRHLVYLQSQKRPGRAGEIAARRLLIAQSSSAVPLSEPKLSTTNLPRTKSVFDS
jgi:hypothetical protein